MLPITSLLWCLPAAGGGAGLAAVYTESGGRTNAQGAVFSDLTPSCLTSAGKRVSSVRRVNSIYKTPTMDFCPLPDTVVH